MRHNHMQSVARKLSIGILTSAFVLTSIFGAFGAQAAERPFLGKAKDITRTSVVLPVKFNELKKKESVLRVRIRNIETNKVEIRKFEFKFNKDGKKNVLITNLMPDTKYKFSVKARKETVKHYSDSSRTRTATTKP